jgi:hypothetical protein
MTDSTRTWQRQWHARPFCVAQPPSAVLSSDMGETPMPLMGETPMPLMGETPMPLMGETPMPLMGGTPMPRGAAAHRAGKAGRA